MAIRCLTPSDIDCQYTNNCKKISYEYCSICKNNKVAIERKQKEKEKKDYFKRI
jgi:hypothetical protein